MKKSLSILAILVLILSLLSTVALAADEVVVEEPISMYYRIMFDADGNPQLWGFAEGVNPLCRMYVSRLYVDEDGNKQRELPTILDLKSKKETSRYYTITLPGTYYMVVTDIMSNVYRPTYNIFVDGDETGLTELRVGKKHKVFTLAEAE